MPWIASHQPLAMWLIFAITYVGIALGRFPKLVLDRTGIALLGAIAMLLVHGVSIAEAATQIDYPTILLLFGLMIFSAQLRVAGFYVWTGQFLTRLTDRPKRLLAGLIAVSAVLSALLANDIVCLAFTPLLCQALLSARRDPIPYLLALATSSNIGSAATIIGNPQNMYIGTVAHLPFGHFSLVMIPPVLVGLALCWAMIVLLFRSRLTSPPSAVVRASAVSNSSVTSPGATGGLPASAVVPISSPGATTGVSASAVAPISSSRATGGSSANAVVPTSRNSTTGRSTVGPNALISATATHDGQTLFPSSLPLQSAIPQRDAYLIGKTLLILAALVIFFLYETGPAASERRAIAALVGAGLLLCSHRAKAAKLYQLVDWNLLLLFLGLFVVNGAMKERHLTEQVLHAIAAQGVHLDRPIPLSAVTLALSNLVSNVPAVLLLQPSLAAADSRKLWYLLALVSTWAGNLTLVGSIANLIVAESAAAFGVKLDLKTYCKLGIPLTVVTVILGTAWLMLVM